MSPELAAAIEHCAWEAARGRTPIAVLMGFGAPWGGMRAPDWDDVALALAAALRRAVTPPARRAA
jgi:hypothetical protein